MLKNISLRLITCLFFVGTPTIGKWWWLLFIPFSSSRMGNDGI